MPSLKLVRVDWLLSCPESKTLKEHRKTNPHRTLDLFQLAPMSPLLRRTKGDVSFHTPGIKTMRVRTKHQVQTWQWSRGFWSAILPVERNLRFRIFRPRRDF